MPTDITLTDEELRLTRGALLAAFMRTRDREHDLDKLIDHLDNLHADQQMDSLLGKSEPQAAPPPGWQLLSVAKPAIGQWALIAWADGCWGMWFVQRTEKGWVNREGTILQLDGEAARLWHPISPFPVKGAKL